jgi:ribosomal protein S19
MALILDSLYDALKAAGASEEQARLNRIERDLTVLKWMVGAVIAVQLGTFWMQWQVVDRLAGIDARISVIAPSAAAIRSSLADD